jgi:hypothetical protein
MNYFFTASTATFFYFLVAGSAIVYLILKFDKQNRRKLNKVLAQAQDVQPMYMKKAAEYKLHTLKMACNEKATVQNSIEKQLDELVADYDKGHITLPDYCNRLRRLQAMNA